MATVFVTGGAGYVGSHCCKAFAEQGWEVVTIDNLSRGWREFVRWGPLVEADLTDAPALADAFRRFRPDLVVHVAGYAYVGESTYDPSIYYKNNVVGSFTLIEEMRRAEVFNLAFSSTCAVYGDAIYTPLDEAHPQNPTNPYGYTKLAVERMLSDFGRSYGLNSVSLRYFNAAGGVPDAGIGERHAPETHLIPLAIEAALGGTEFTINGTDFATRDGTAVRDYVHVADLARAHLLAADLLRREGGVHQVNLGAGRGLSVLDVLRSVESLTGRRIRTTPGPRRAGDPAELFASAQRAQERLGWAPTCSDLDHIIKTALSWRLQDGPAPRIDAAKAVSL
jgi:UDP-arabinose 4-epimerase